MNVVVIAPHPDDEALGCGGAIRLHADRGNRIAAVFLTSGELGLKYLPVERAWRVREREAAEAASVLGIASTRFLRGSDWGVSDEEEKLARLLAAALREEAPELIYLPHPGEWHPDHAAALAVAIRALQDWETALPQLQTYEVWTPLASYDHIEDISAVIGPKIEAVRRYQSQLDQTPYDRAILGLSQYRGAMAGRCDYAEAFQRAGIPHLDRSE